MKKTIYIIAVALVFTLVSCHKKDVVKINGTITNGAGKTMWIEELTPDGPQFIDSLRLDSKGQFKFTHPYTYQTFYYLHASPTDYIVLLPYKDEEVKVTGDMDSLDRSYYVEGSQECTLLWQLQDYSNMGTRKLMEVLAKDQANRAQYGFDTPAYKEAKKETDSLFREAYDEQFLYLSRYITENSGSLSTIIALYKPFNGDRPVIDVDRYPELFTFYEMVIEGLEADDELKDNPHTIHFKNVVERVRYQAERNMPQASGMQLTVGE